MVVITVCLLELACSATVMNVSPVLFVLETDPALVQSYSLPPAPHACTLMGCVGGEPQSFALVAVPYLKSVVREPLAHSQR